MWIIDNFHQRKYQFSNYHLFVFQQIAELVATEFFEQGDKERRELNIEPIVSSLLTLWKKVHFLFYKTGVV